jgi:glycosyltransferase WbpL
MRSEILWTTAAAVPAAALLTLAARKLALARGLVDVPSARSSHQASTPRGGGVAIVLVTTVMLLILLVMSALPLRLFIALTVGGLAVAMIGFADDHRPLPSSVRLIVHFSAAIWAVAWLGGLPPLRFGAEVVHPGWLGDVVAVLGIVWVLNLFNFMDGIDGFAASEAMFVLLGGAWLTGGSGMSGGASAALVLAGASGGFLLWNWPPAKIFLGDVGSGYLGYTIAVLALAAASDNPTALWVWLILGGAFFVDATVTLVRRTLRGERPQEPHRTHAYQWLARGWNSHRRVTVALLAVNCVWLLPCALYATRHPPAAALAVLISFAPLAVLTLIAGSGRPEGARSTRC